MVGGNGDVVCDGNRNVEWQAKLSVEESKLVESELRRRSLAEKAHAGVGQLRLGASGINTIIFTCQKL
jgi:hypothetical protein